MRYRQRFQFCVKLKYDKNLFRSFIELIWHLAFKIIWRVLSWFMIIIVRIINKNKEINWHSRRIDLLPTALFVSFKSYQKYSGPVLKEDSSEIPATWWSALYWLLASRAVCRKPKLNRPELHQRCLSPNDCWIFLNIEVPKKLWWHLN
jgi:hypothetical protein